MVAMTPEILPLQERGADYGVSADGRVWRLTRSTGYGSVPYMLTQILAAVRAARGMTHPDGATA